MKLTRSVGYTNFLFFFKKKEMIQCLNFFERIGEIGQKVSAKLLNITTEVYLPKPITYL